MIFILLNLILQIKLQYRNNDNCGFFVRLIVVSLYVYAHTLHLTDPDINASLSHSLSIDRSIEWILKW